MKKLIILMSNVVLCQLAIAQPGTLDPSFGNNGFITTPSPVIGNAFQSIPRQCFLSGDGKIFLLLETNGKAKLTRRLQDGSLDVTYGHNGYSNIVSMHPVSASLQGDGKIVVAGNLDSPTGFMVARFGTDGTLDPAFGDNGIVKTSVGSGGQYVSAVAITSDNKIIVGGNATFTGHSQFLLVRYTTSGALDNSFGNDGISTSDFFNASSNISSMALQSDGKIVAAGVANGPGGGDFALARYNSDGSPDLSFGIAGKTTSDFSFNDWARSVVIDPNGAIYAGGQSATFGAPDFTVARYTASGVLDPTYNGGSGFVVVNPGPSFDILLNICLQPDGKLVAAGHTDINPTGNDIELVRINANGIPDNSFGPNSNGIIYADINSDYDEGDFLAVQPDGKILVGGFNVSFTPIFTSRFSCFRYNNDGTLDNSFDHDGLFTDFVPGGFFNYSTLFQQSDGKLLATADFNGGDATNRYLYRLNSNGSVDNSFGGSGFVDISNSGGSAFFQPDGKLIDLLFDNGDIKLVRHNADGTIDASFGNNGTVISDFGNMESPTVAGFQPDSKILIGGISRDANGSDMLLVRYNANGSIDNSFGNGGFIKVDFENEDGAQAIIVMSDGRIIFGGTSIIFAPDFSFAHFDDIILRLNPDGSFDNSFGDQGRVVIDKSDFDYLGGVIVQSDNKVVYAYYASADGGNTNTFMERLDSGGNPDLSFGQNGIVVTDGGALLSSTDQKLIVSGLHLNNRNNQEFAMARYDADGHPDPSFGTNGRKSDAFTANDNNVFTNLIAGNQLFVSGSGTDEHGSMLGVIARYFLETNRNITCPGARTVNTDNNVCNAIVNDIDPQVSPSTETYTFQLSGATSGSGSGSASGRTFNRGATTVTYTLTNDPSKTCSFIVTVVDAQAPAINGLVPSATSLWPPNHKMKDVLLTYTVSDNCGIDHSQISVSSDEPVQTNEPGDQSPDWQIIDDHHIKLRAERLESGNGRTYTITVTSTDINGNQNSNSTTVVVPRSMGSERVDLITNAAPNPSNNFFTITINSKSTEKVNFRLLNAQGIEIKSINAVTVGQTLRIGDGLLPGIYYLEAKQTGEIKTIKLVKL